MKNYLNTKDYEGKKTSVELMTFSHSSCSTKAQELIESKLNNVAQRVMTPPGDNQYLVYMIDDINMAYKDKYGH